MSRQERILDDVARLAGGAISLASETKEQVKSAIKNRVDELAQSMDLVPRDDFERLLTSHEKTRHELELLKNRIIELEMKLTSS